MIAIIGRIFIIFAVQGKEKFRRFDKLESTET